MTVQTSKFWRIYVILDLALFRSCVKLQGPQEELLWHWWSRSRCHLPPTVPYCCPLCCYVAQCGQASQLPCEAVHALEEQRSALLAPAVIRVCVLSFVLCVLCSARLALWRCGPCYSKQTDVFLNAFVIKDLHGDYLKSYPSKTCLSPLLSKCYTWFFCVPVMWRIFCCLPFSCSSPHSCIT